MTARPLTLLGLAMIALLLPTVARALDSLVTVTDCQSVQVSGHTGQQLTLRIAGQHQFFDTVVLRPAAAIGVDTASIVAFTAPPGWQSYYDPSTGALLLMGDPVPLGQSLDGFGVTLGRVPACLDIDLSNFLLLDSPGWGVGCFQSCVATRARDTSWGRLKLLYR